MAILPAAVERPGFVPLLNPEILPNKSAEALSGAQRSSRIRSRPSESTLNVMPGFDILIIVTWDTRSVVGQTGSSVTACSGVLP